MRRSPYDSHIVAHTRPRFEILILRLNGKRHIVKRDFVLRRVPYEDDLGNASLPMVIIRVNDHPCHDCEALRTDGGNDLHPALDSTARYCTKNLAAPMPHTDHPARIYGRHSSRHEICFPDEVSNECVCGLVV